VFQQVDSIIAQIEPQEAAAADDVQSTAVRGRHVTGPRHVGTNGRLEAVSPEEQPLDARGVRVAQQLRARTARGLALATQSHLDFDAVRAAENAIRAPTELRLGAPPPTRPHAATGQNEMEDAHIVDAAETATEPVFTEASYAAVQLQGTTRAERGQSIWGVLEANARPWVEAAGNGAAAQIARASAHAAGGYLDPSDFAAASSSDSASSEGSSDSDASDSSGEPLFGAAAEPRVEADL